MFYKRVSDAAAMDIRDLAGEIWRSVNGEMPLDGRDSEYISWKESLPRLIRVLQDAGLGNITIAAECELPTGGRIDVVLLGYSAADKKPLAVLVEMKQWSCEGIELYDNGYTSIRVHSSHGDYQSMHPVCQTDGYMKYMERNHEGVIDGRLEVKSCQYLFNFAAAKKNDLFSRDFEKYRAAADRMFCMGEENRFKEFLEGLFSHEFRDDPEVLSLFFDSVYRMTDLDMDVFRNITEQEENISLLEDQIPITECINMAIERLLSGTLDRKYMFLISGAAGTGKTIVGFKLLSDYCRMFREVRGGSRYRCAYTLPRSRTIKAVLDGIGGGMQTVFLNNLRGDFDLLVVDEAHRITGFGADSGYVGRTLNSAGIVVVLQDDRQRVLGSEIGTVDRYRAFARENGFVFQPYQLKLQKRAGFGGYVERIDQLLYGETVGRARESGIEVRVCDTLPEMESLVNGKHRTNRSVKYYAPYCWEWKSRRGGKEMDIAIPEENPVFRKQWNPYPVEMQFSWYTDSIDQVGCIYTAQGLGYDYVALIWWEDLRWDRRDKKWKVDFSKVTPYDTLLAPTIKDGADYDEIMLNIYRVLLTRAKKGIYIWFKDRDTREHFKEVVLC